MFTQDRRNSPSNQMDLTHLSGQEWACGFLRTEERFSVELEAAHPLPPQGKRLQKTDLSFPQLADAQLKALMLTDT